MTVTITYAGRKNPCQRTGSLAGVMEQMEHFSSQLVKLSSRVESSHESSARSLEEEVRHRDEQLRVMEDRLDQQQAAMMEERAYFKEAISRMDRQLNEKQMQLEKEHSKMTAELAKAESTQSDLEEERRVLNMQISMEWKELERAKSTLLEERISVIQRCADERRKLAAEWTNFHICTKDQLEKAEREASSFLQKREASIISRKQEQAGLKLHAAALKRKEQSLAPERESLDRLMEELEREKRRSSSTLRLSAQAPEAEAFSMGRRQLNHVQSREGLRGNLSIQQIPSILPESRAPFSNSGPTATLNGPSPQSVALQASLALWKYTAEKDQEYL